jgi:hypothetical protein
VKLLKSVFNFNRHFRFLYWRSNVPWGLVAGGGDIQIGYRNHGEK